MASVQISEFSDKEECIPVGCVPPTAVAVRGEPGSDSPQFPLGCGPGPDPTQLSLGCGPGDPPGSDQTSPEQAPPRSRHAPQDQTPCPGSRHPPPPWTEFLTHACENITLPQTSFVGSRNICHWSVLCKRQRYYHNTNKTQVAKRIFELSPIHASVIYQIHWIHWISDRFRKTPP